MANYQFLFKYCSYVRPRSACSKSNSKRTNDRTWYKLHKPNENFVTCEIILKKQNSSYFDPHDRGNNFM